MSKHNSTPFHGPTVRLFDDRVRVELQLEMA